MARNPKELDYNSIEYKIIENYCIEKKIHRKFHWAMFQIYQGFSASEVVYPPGYSLPSVYCIYNQKKKMGCETKKQMLKTLVDLIQDYRLKNKNLKLPYIP